MPAPFRSIEPRLAGADPDGDQRPKAVRDFLRRRLIRCCGTRNYATAGDEAAHDGAARGTGERRRCRGCLIERQQDAAAVGVICGDHSRAAFPRAHPGLRLERPPVRGEALLVETREHIGHRVLVQLACMPSADSDEKLAPLRAAGSGEAQEVALLRLTQPARVIGVVAALATDRDRGRPLRERSGDAGGVREFERPRQRLLDAAPEPQSMPECLLQRYGARGDVEPYPEALLARGDLSGSRYGERRPPRRPFHGGAWWNRQRKERRRPARSRRGPVQMTELRIGPQRSMCAAVGEEMIELGTRRKLR